MAVKPPKIVVITPVKNEEWILERFLSITSQIADHIIIADQNSTDRSAEICKKYSKVTLIENNSDYYDEASRQILLIRTARELVPEHKIILALDADEIIAANAMETLGWQSMLQAKPGTALCFEKPDLYLTPYQCIRYDVPWPIGYVDDGAEHMPKSIHSIRIPITEYAAMLHIHDVKILHYALTRWSGQAAKMRFYSILENVLNTQSVVSRRQIYASNKNYLQLGRLEPSLSEWFTDWEDLGIDMYTILNQQYYWYDFEVLKYFHKYGLKRFWIDDIWSFDWEAVRLYSKSIGISDIPESKIYAPPKIISLILTILTRTYVALKRLIKQA